MDVHSTATRSYNMSRIKSKDTRPELLVRRWLHAHGYRYRLHVKTLPGKPDIVLGRKTRDGELVELRTIILVHGCFWHGHEGCRYYVVPKTRTDWWLNKINRNKDNDHKAHKALKKLGWKVTTLWECDLKPAVVERTLNALLKKLNATADKQH